ncbi:MAG: iron-sulfur cluster repair di-iron protein [Pyrinomonas methylaliphatogenes]|jgi:regulator of cell morphogenesis and NO signaling|nr:iron-sulfur cluster repair di-iron protein [Pyrinomonas methylaliphatogenes]
MMNIDPTKTVREIALELPNATHIFERFKIDYCCGGDKSLSEACQAVGADPREVAQSLAEASGRLDEPSVDFRAVSLADLIDHIVAKHHAYTRQEMERLGPLFQKVCAAHGEKHPELLAMREVFGQMCAELEAHMFKEERVLFPYIIKLERADERDSLPPLFGGLSNPVRVMIAEHDSSGEDLRKLRRLSADYAAPDDACTSYRVLYRSLEELERDLHRHIHLENNILFPRALKLEEEIGAAK